MTNVPRATVGIIGGTGLYNMDMDDVQEVTLSTPYGEPSGPFTIGEMGGVTVAFLPRHGIGHRISPTELNSRANIHAFKQLGVERVVSVSAVGSLREEIAPLHLVVPDQLIDRTRLRGNTFFGDGVVAHISFADPFCPDLSAQLADAVEEDASATVHRGGALVVIEGSRVLHPGGVRPLPRLGREHHRHDGSARGETGARGGDVLRHARLRYRLRCMAGRVRKCDG